MLSLCFGLLTPLGAGAQDLSDTTGAPAEETPEPTVETPPSEEEAAPADEADAVAEPEPALASEVAAPAAEPAPEPAPEAMPVADPTTSPAPGSQQAEATTSVSIDDLAASGEKDPAGKAERCAQLMAQGNSALAQAEGCGGGGTPIFAGSIVSIGQAFAPATFSLPDSDNHFTATSLYYAPRLRLTQKWALIFDGSMAIEETTPDDTADPHEAQFSDPRLTAIGNLYSAGGFTFTGGPRVVLPISKPSRQAKGILGTGALLSVVRPFDVLGGLALVASGSYQHNFQGRVTREPESDKNDYCNDVSGSQTLCPVSGLAAVQDAFRAIGVVSLNVNAQWGLQAAYLYGWNFAKKLSELPSELPGVISDDTPVREGNAVSNDPTRWRRLGSLTLTANYQPVDWLIASVSANTSVCYNLPSGGQTALGGCAGGSQYGTFWETNPLLNKYSTLSMSFTIPIDAVYMRIKQNQAEDKQVAAKKGEKKKSL